MTEQVTTIRWVDQLGRLCEIDLPTSKLALAQPITGFGEPRRHEPEEAVERLEAEQQRIAERREELLHSWRN